MPRGQKRHEKRGKGCLEEQSPGDIGVGSFPEGDAGSVAGSERVVRTVSPAMDGAALLTRTQNIYPSWMTPEFLQWKLEFELREREKEREHQLRVFQLKRKIQLAQTLSRSGIQNCSEDMPSFRIKKYRLFNEAGNMSFGKEDDYESDNEKEDDGKSVDVVKLIQDRFKQEKQSLDVEDILGESHIFSVKPTMSELLETVQDSCQFNSQWSVTELMSATGKSTTMTEDETDPGNRMEDYVPPSSMYRCGTVQTDCDFVAQQMLELERQKHEEALSEVRCQLEDALETCKVLRLTVEAKEQAILELEKEKEHLSDIADSHDTLKQHIAELESQVASKEFRLFEVEQKVRHVEERHKEEMDQVQERLSIAQEQLQREKVLVKELTHQLSQEKRQSKHAKRQLENLKSGLQEANHVADARQHQIASMRAELELKQKRQECSKLQVETKELQRKKCETEKNKLYNDVVQVGSIEVGQVKKLAQEDNTEIKEELISVHPVLSLKHKPHRAYDDDDDANEDDEDSENKSIEDENKADGYDNKDGPGDNFKGDFAVSKNKLKVKDKLLMKPLETSEETNNDEGETVDTKKGKAKDKKPRKQKRKNVIFEEEEDNSDDDHEEKEKMRNTVLSNVY